MRDLLDDYQQLERSGRTVGRAVVTSVWGSAPRPEGACLLATDDGRIAGSVSGGCVESATAEEIVKAMGSGAPRLVTFGVSHERAWEVGLACGGTIKVFVEPTVRPEILAAARGEGGVVVATVIDVGGSATEGPSGARERDLGAREAFRAARRPSAPRERTSATRARGSPSGRLGGSAVLREDGTVEAAEADRWIAPAVAEAARAALRSEASTTVEVAAPEGGTAAIFLEVFARRPKLVIFGGVHIAMALVPLAKSLGYHTTVADGRQAFVTRERFPEADRLLVAWPEQAFEQAGLDRATYVCVLSHDPKFDEPALDLALRSQAAYIGAIGSRKTQAARRERLRREGFTEQDLARLHGPIGVDLGGRTPAETALAIMAEITMLRYGGTGGLLGRGS
jgi:xanthine dehydrogenase accessory factor